MQTGGSAFEPRVAVRACATWWSIGPNPQPADPADLDLIHEILSATIIYDLAAEPDTHNARDIAERLTAVLRQTGYRSEGMVQT